MGRDLVSGALGSVVEVELGALEGGELRRELRPRVLHLIVPRLGHRDCHCPQLHRARLRLRPRLCRALGSLRDEEDVAVLVAEGEGEGAALVPHKELDLAGHVGLGAVGAGGPDARRLQVGGGALGLDLEGREAGEDRVRPRTHQALLRLPHRRPRLLPELGEGDGEGVGAVSYTHLTLPTICSV
eukprot:1789652-Rhodomonas_salina.1